MKTLFSVFIFSFLTLTGNSSWAQFKCVSGSGRCQNSNDVTCRFTNHIWQKIKEKEDQWSKFLLIEFVDEKTVRYSSISKFCKFRGYTGSKEGQVTLFVNEDTELVKKFRLVHSACGKDEVLTEDWEIHGVGLKPLDPKELIFSLNRKFDLLSNEKYKKFTLGSGVGKFESFEGNRLPFDPFYAQDILIHLAQRVDAKNDKNQPVNELRSDLWIFDKQLITQNINVTENKSQSYFYSPILPFYGLSHRSFFRFRDGPSACNKSYVNISFDKYLEIKPSKSSSTLGLTFNEYQTQCLNRESKYYRDQLVKVLDQRLNKYFPKFTEENVSTNEKLENDIKNIINFIEAGDVVTSLQLVQKLLVEVKSGSIRDARQ